MLGINLLYAADGGACRPQEFPNAMINEYFLISYPRERVSRGIKN